MSHLLAHSKCISTKRSVQDHRSWFPWENLLATNFEPWDCCSVYISTIFIHQSILLTRQLLNCCSQTVDVETDGQKSSQNKQFVPVIKIHASEKMFWWDELISSLVEDGSVWGFNPRNYFTPNASQAPSEDSIIIIIIIVIILMFTQFSRKHDQKWPEVFVARNRSKRLEKEGAKVQMQLT